MDASKLPKRSHSRCRSCCRRLWCPCPYRSACGRVEPPAFPAANSSTVVSGGCLGRPLRRFGLCDGDKVRRPDALQEISLFNAALDPDARLEHERPQLSQAHVEEFLGSVYWQLELHHFDLVSSFVRDVTDGKDRIGHERQTVWLVWFGLVWWAVDDRLEVESASSQITA